MSLGLKVRWVTDEGKLSMDLSTKVPMYVRWVIGGGLSGRLVRVESLKVFTDFGILCVWTSAPRIRCSTRGGKWIALGKGPAISKRVID